MFYYVIMFSCYYVFLFLLEIHTLDKDIQNIICAFAVLISFNFVKYELISKNPFIHVDNVYLYVL